MEKRQTSTRADTFMEASGDSNTHNGSSSSFISLDNATLRL